MPTIRSEAAGAGPFLDTDANMFLSARDAVLVIDAMNAAARAAGAEGEGELATVIDVYSPVPQSAAASSPSGLLPSFEVPRSGGSGAAASIPRDSGSADQLETLKPLAGLPVAGHQAVRASLSSSGNSGSSNIEDLLDQLAGDISEVWAQDELSRIFGG